MDTTSPQRYEINGLWLELTRPQGALRRLGAGEEVWCDGAAAGEPLWQLYVANAAGHRRTLDGSAAARTAVEAGGPSLRLRWEAVADAASGAGPFDVTIRIRPADRDALTAWRIDVTNRAADWTLWHVVFPRLGGLMPAGTGRDDRLYWPDGWGRQAAGWAAMPDIDVQPSGWSYSMQFIAYAHGRRMLYFGWHDPHHFMRRIAFQKTPRRPRKARVYLTNYPEDMSVCGNAWRQGYDNVVGVLDGDWYDAARTYGRWARRQDWAARPAGAADRPPPERRQVHAWVLSTINEYPVDRVVTVNGRPVSRWTADVRRLAEHLGARIGVHLYQWHRTPFDTDYPHYFPVKDGLAELIAELKDAGVLVMPYINGRLWDISTASFIRDGAERFATKGVSHRADPPRRFLHLEEYPSRQKLANMCIATPFWRDRITETCRRIVHELGCDAVYIDQMGAAYGTPCFDPSHGHPLGGGGYALDGYRRLSEAIRREVGPECLLTTETNWEGCVADYDGLLSYIWSTDDMIPIFATVHWGQATMFGCEISDEAMRRQGGREFVRRMSMLFVWGAQLGWNHLTILLEKRLRPVLEHFGRLCRLRAEHAATLCRGEFLRPPRLTDAGTGRPCRSPLAGPVLGSMWSAPERDGALVLLANVTRRAVEVTVEVADDRWRSAQPAAGPDAGASDGADSSVAVRALDPGAFGAALPALGAAAVTLRRA
jgi:hypothetical protein